MKKLSLIITIILLMGCSNSKNKAPTIEYQDDGRVHVIDEATFSSGTLDYYLFCPSEEENYDNCNWKITRVDSVDVAREGKWYFYFKGVSTTGEESEVSNVVYVELLNEK